MFTFHREAAPRRPPGQTPTATFNFMKSEYVSSLTGDLCSTAFAIKMVVITVGEESCMFDEPIISEVLGCGTMYTLVTENATVNTVC
jgi:hypothetical protein